MTRASGAAHSGVLREAVAGDVRHFTSVLLGDVNSAIASGILFEGLVTQLRSGEMIPALADSMPELSEDGRRYTFRLRRGLKWSDGRPLTARDVAFTWRLMWDADYAELKSPRRPELERHLEDIRVEDDETIVFCTRTPFGPFVTTHGTYGILPEHVLGDMTGAELNDCDFDRAPTVANGLLRYAGRREGEEVVLERNPLYHGGPSRLERLRLLVHASHDEIADLLLAGEVDVGEIPPWRAEEIEQAPDLDLVEFDVPNFEFCLFQLDPERPQSELFRSVDVRRALNWGTDRDAIVRDVFCGHAEIAHSVQPLTSWAHDPAVEPRYAYDPSRAERTLDAEGWLPGEDGVRRRDGRRFSFTLAYNGGAPLQQRVAEQLRNDWARIGVELLLGPLPFAQLLEQMRYGREFEALLMNFGVGADPEISNLWASRNRVTGAFNGQGFADDEIDRLLDEAAASHDREERRERYVRLQRRMAELCPGVLLVYPRGLFVVNRRVRGTGFGSFNRYSVRPWLKDVEVA
ncbi:MAG: ABC transporter substrate-binding protein [Acidimicrobiia bacterium]